MAGRKIFSLFGSIAIEGMAKSKADLSDFDKKMRATNKALNRLGRDMTKTGKALSKNLTAPVLGLTAAVGVLTKATGDYADKLLDLEQITGLSTDNLQGLESVAIEAGVNFDNLANSMAKFTSKLPEIASGTGYSSEAIKQLGVNIFDAQGNVRDMNELFPELVTKLQGIGNETERNALAQQIFGRSLKDIAPVLGLNSDRFLELFNGAEQLSSYMSGDAIKSANEFRIMLENLQREFLGVGRGLATQLIPVLMDTFIPFLRDTAFPILQGIIKLVGSLADWFNNLSKPVKDFAITFGALLVAAGPVLLLFAKLLPLIKTIVALYKVLTTAQITLNAVMAANPIGLIVIGIAALIAAGVALYKNWDTVKEKFIDVWDGIRYHFKNIASYIAIGYGKMILGILKGIRSISKFLPGDQKLLNSLINKTGVGIKVLERGIKARKAQREAQQAALKLQKAEAKALEASTKATEENTEAVGFGAAAKKEATEESIEAARKEYEEKVRLAREAEQHERDILNSLEEATIVNLDNRREALSRSTALKLKMLDEERDEEIRKATEAGKSTANIAELYEQKKLTIQRDAAKQEIQIARDVQKEKIDAARSALSAISSVVSTLNNIWGSSLEKRTAEIDKEREARIAAAESSILDAEQREVAIAKINEEADAKKLELQRENARREKVNSIFSIILSTAMGVAAALTIPPPAGIALAAVVGALGAIQLGIAAATPIPFAEGGMVKSDPGRGILAQIGEGKEDELVLPMKTGAAQLAANMMDRLASAGVGATGAAIRTVKEVHNHYHIGTLIADEFGIKKFAKKVNKYVVAESQRTGGASVTA